ncbi:hypothetical protein AB0N07_35880 [Streptomyces sp. NPDC051172]|uniref:hypothetical protein n=1 Tax=Streptomyces sp. NPDC051172 TaxID=3155796 RepID=UPI0034214E40
MSRSTMMPAGRDVAYERRSGRTGPGAGRPSCRAEELGSHLGGQSADADTGLVDLLERHGFEPRPSF